MRKCFIAAILFMLTISAKAQEKQAILKLMQTQTQDWNRGDIPAFMNGYWKSDSLMFVGSKGPTYGWQQTLERYQKAYPDKTAMGQLTFKIIKVELLGKNDAFVFGGWRLQREKDAPGGYFTLWFRKINGQWKIVVDHTS